MSYNIPFGPTRVDKIEESINAAYTAWSDAGPKTDQQGSGQRFADDQREAARWALDTVIDGVKRGLFGTEHGDAVVALQVDERGLPLNADTAGTAINADVVKGSVSGHGRRLAVLPEDNSAPPSCTISITWTHEPEALVAQATTPVVDMTSPPTPPPAVAPGPAFAEPTPTPSPVAETVVESTPAPIVEGTVEPAAEPTPVNVTTEAIITPVEPKDESLND